MKLVPLLFLICFTTLVLGQSKDEQLYKAVTTHDSIKVESLLKEGANPNFRKKTASFETSLLTLAVTNQDIQITKLLIEHKADVNYKDWFKTTALMYAASKGNKRIAEILIAAGADPKASDDQGNTVLSAAKESNDQGMIEFIQSLQKK
jgi:ankyrin repeat protein